LVRGILIKIIHQKASTLLVKRSHSTSKKVESNLSAISRL